MPLTIALFGVIIGYYYFPFGVIYTLLLLIPYALFEMGYGINPRKFTMEKHFRERGYESVSNEFQTSKKIFVTVISLLVIAILLYSYALTLPTATDPDPDPLPLVLGLIIFNINAFFLFATIGAGLRILTYVAHKEFRFYLAKGYCITATKKLDEFEMSRYLSTALDSYNKYLRRRSKIEIKNIKKIYATFLVADIKDKNQIISSICESLEDDRLKLARHLFSVYKDPDSEFFAGESLTHKLKIIGTFLAAAIPILLSIIQLVMASPNS
jgi:hypothetical protein